MKKYVLAELDAELSSLIKDNYGFFGIDRLKLSSTLLVAKYLKLIAHKLID